MNLLTEDDLIATLFAPIAGAGGLGLLDDAALLRPSPGTDLVVTADALVAGVHFFADDPPDAIACKALGVNLSDLAAKGATPLGFVLTIALPPDWTSDWLARFAAGLADTAAAAACPLVGGDTVRTPGPLTLSITAFGSVPLDRMVKRTGARAGDFIYVSGTIGDAALGLRACTPATVPAGLADVHRAALRDRYLRPQPRSALAGTLQAHASGGMDVSDGLVGDLIKMMKASGTTAAVDLARVPLSEAAAAWIAADPDAWSTAMTGGDDYEILATVPPSRAFPFEAAGVAAGVGVTRIGTVGAGQGAPLFSGRDGAPAVFATGSYSHF